MTTNIRQILKSFGSLKLAVVLLAVIAGVCAVATVYESKTSPQAALRLFYRSWWFTAVLALLSANVAAAALARWPWKKKQIGFVTTHIGLIVLLGGCSAAFHYGTEGMMPLRVGETPARLVQLEDYAVTTHMPGGSAHSQIMLRWGRDGRVLPREVLLADDVRLTLEELIPNAGIEHSIEAGGDKPNPAIRLRMASDSMQHNASQWLLAHEPGANRAAWGPAVVEFLSAPVQAESELKGLMLRVILQPDGELRYAASSRTGTKSGVVKVGEVIEPGWMDLKVHVESLLTNAVVREKVVRLAVHPSENTPALRVTARQGNTKADAWLSFGEPSTMMLAGKPLHVTFGWATQELPFTVVLEDFIVERNEGTDQPAGWTSRVVFHDERRGLTQKADVWMNHPGWFGGYKFSQSSWNPNDLKYTVLQVKKDPRTVMWLTWIGSALIIAGITLQFYGRRWI